VQIARLNTAAVAPIPRASTNTTSAANLAIAVSSAEAVAKVPPRAIDKRQTPVANH
jgi:hypothetical protein